MNLIDYEYLKKRAQEKEKGIIMHNGDILHIIINEVPHTELIVKCIKNKIEIMEKEDFYNQSKKLTKITKKRG